MSTTKTATSYKLSLGVENGVNALGACLLYTSDAADD